MFVHDRFTLPPGGAVHARRADREFHAVFGAGGNRHPQCPALELARPDVTIDRPARADPWAETGGSIADPPCMAAPAAGVKEIVRALVGSAIAEVERELILETLTRTCGNRTRAAGMLGISIRTLRNKIRGYQAGGLAVIQPAGNGASAALPQLSCE